VSESGSKRFSEKTNTVCYTARLAIPDNVLIASTRTKKQSKALLTHITISPFRGT